MTVPRWLGPLGLAVLLTSINMAKPLVIDDTAYVLFARQITVHPTDPYGFDLLWYHQSQPAMTVLAPPVIPYWLALEQRVFGENPTLWKLGLFPFAWLLTASVASLVRRFAPSFSIPLTLMMVLSPVVLPGFNLMLDVPALALMLAGIVVFFRSLDRPRTLSLILAGVLLGLAMQTKYTALLGPGVVLWAGWTHGRLRDGMITSGLAVLIFFSWEAYLFSQYGASHFVFHLSGQGGDSLVESVSRHLKMTGPLLGYLGGLGQGLGLFAWAAVGVSRPVFRFLVIGSVLGLPLAVGTSTIPLVFMGQGLIIAIGVIGVGIMLLRRASSPMDRFLLGWFVLELIGVVALTPFGAARRLLSPMTVSILLCGRLAEVSIATTDQVRRRWVNIAAWFGVTLGMGYGLIDLIDAYPEKWAAEQSAAWIRTHDPDAESIWFTGHWGFRYYAEREGMKPIDPEVSVVPIGAWVVLPDPQRAHRPVGQAIEIPRATLEPITRMEWTLPISVSTNPAYYGGRYPLERRSGSRGEACAVVIYQVRKEWRPRNPTEIRFTLTSGADDVGS